MIDGRCGGRKGGLSCRGSVLLVLLLRLVLSLRQIGHLRDRLGRYRLVLVLSVA